VKSRYFIFLVLLLQLPVNVLAETYHDHLKQHLLSRMENLPAEVIKHYRQSGFTYLWVRQGKLLPRAYGVVKLLQKAADKGLRSEDYPYPAIRLRWAATSPEALAELEVLLTQAFVAYSRHLANGRWLPSRVDPQWHITKPPLDAISLLARLDGNNIELLMQDIEPVHAGYQALIEKLAEYRQIAAQGGWPVVGPGPILRAGRQHADVPRIRERLKATRDLILGPVVQADNVDVVFMDAVMRFQARQGLAIDGIVGPQTRAAMDIPVEERIHKITINIDRWRWLPRRLGKRYLLINLTGFELYAEEEDKTVMAMPIIIGKRYRSTPSFSSKVRYLEINPYWTIPKTIMLEDLIPIQLRDEEYFNRKQIKAFLGWGQDAEEVDVEEIALRRLNENYFPYRFRQEPGPLNSLGQIKFMFPNPYDIYLHDTPDRHLFNLRIRTFSSGCIRVSDPLRLSAYLLDAPNQQKEEEVLRLIYRGENRSMSLVKAVPIYLLYWTAWTGLDGKLNFSEDIYHRDGLMLQDLAQGNPKYPVYQ